MSFRSRRSRRYGRKVDWLEIGMVVLGVLFLSLALVSAYVAINLVVHFGDADRGAPVGPGLLKVLKVLGIGLFGAGAVAMYAVADWAFGDRVRLGIMHLLHRRRSRDE